MKRRTKKNSMIATILQPSYIPWRGYFHQIINSDIFIFYDDVQYDKHGWRNRNRIKTANGTQWITIPVLSAGAIEHDTPIKDIAIDWNRNWNEKHWQMLKQSYGKTPFFHEYEDWLNIVFHERPNLLADFTINLTIDISNRLGIDGTRFIRSSEIPNICGHKTERLINILKAVNADHYISGPSAKDYIEKDKFDQAGISVEFIEYDYPEYPQKYPPFDPFVSILDLLFMTGPDARKFITVK